MILIPRTTDIYSNCWEGFINRRDWQWCRVQCGACGVYLLASLLKAHMECKHGIYQSFLLNKESLVNTPPTTYRAHLSHKLNRFSAQFQGALGI